MLFIIIRLPFLPLLRSQLLNLIGQLMKFGELAFVFLGF
jgi:hypothetical protein